MVADAKGNLLYIAPGTTEDIRTVTLSAENLRLFREAFTVGMDWDQFTIKVKTRP